MKVNKIHLLSYPKNVTMIFRNRFVKEIIRRHVFMAKNAMKNIWDDKRKEDDRLKKVLSKKKSVDTASNKPEIESSSELKPENK